MNRVFLYCLVLGYSCALIAADDVAATLKMLVEEDIVDIKGHCGSMHDSKVYTYVIHEINKKKAAIPDFENNHSFELQQLITEAENYNDLIYKPLCSNAVQSDIYDSLTINGLVISAYIPLREQALNVIAQLLQTIVDYQQ